MRSSDICRATELKKDKDLPLPNGIISPHVNPVIMVSVSLTNDGDLNCNQSAVTQGGCPSALASKAHRTKEK